MRSTDDAAVVRDGITGRREIAIQIPSEEVHRDDDIRVLRKNDY
jgi:hypothetical protein